MCRGVYQLLRVPGGACRDAAANDPACATLDGITIDEALVEAHEHSWLARALELQRGLDDDIPLQDELWTHTHNSFNADAYALQAAGGLDRNHIYSIRDQLRMGIRAIELDLHWAPHAASGFQNAVQVCHGQVVAIADGLSHHAGCELGSPLLVEHLAEIAAWLDDDPDEVLMLYLQNELEGDPVAHEQAAAVIDAVLGDRVYRPSTDCEALPMDTSRRAIRDSGARVLITGNCGPGSWGAFVHERGPRWKESGLGYGDDFPAYPCTARRASQDYAHNWIRHWGDETGLSATAGSGGDVTPTDALNMTRCGVNMIGWDNLVPFDQRLSNVVWSWRTDEPATSADGACATHGADGRFGAADCAAATPRPFACHDGSQWRITLSSGPWSDGEAACTAEGLGSFSVPWNGYENERLKDAKSGPDVWLDYRALGGTWVS